MRRSTPARNAIDRIREQIGLADATPAAPQSVAPTVLHPLPTTTRGVEPPRMRALPSVQGRPFYLEPQAFDAGSQDYIARQRVQLEDVPKGAPSESVLVYPAWESRLVGMRDFLAPITATLIEVVTPATVQLSAYAVPQGWTAFWKTFRFFLDPVPAALTPTNTLVTLLVDGDPVMDYFNLPMGPLMTLPEKTFVIAAEGRRLSLRIAFTAAVGNVSATAWGLLYGNLRPRTGAAPANEVGERDSSPPPPAPIAPAAAVPAPQRPDIVWWESVIVGQGRQLIPLVISGPGLVNRWRGYKSAARDLTAAELSQWADWLRQTDPRGRR